MDLKDILKKSLPYAAATAIVALQTPLHESMHAGLAEILPGVDCTGIVLDSNDWYALPLDWAGIGYIETADLAGTGVAGYAMTTTQNTTLGHLSGAIVSAGPEVASMTLGFYLIGNAMNNIWKKPVGSVIYAVCASEVITGTHFYLKQSSLSPGNGADHLGFTENMLQLLHLPEAVAPYFTFIGGATMVAASLALASMIPNGNTHKELKGETA